MKIKNMNIVRFKTEVSTRVNWLETKPIGKEPMCTAFASFDDMFSIAWTVIQMWRQKFKYCSSQYPEISRNEIRRWLEQASVLSVAELNSIENIHVVHSNWRTIPEIGTQQSLIVNYVHSKEKFVDATVHYIELTDPLFFLMSEN